MNPKKLKEFLDRKVEEYNRPDFIPSDPVSIPHLFTRRQDVEIMGFFAATLAWGQRVTIINNCHKLIKLMDGAPYDFVRTHEEKDLKRFFGFAHRTFNDTDLLYFIAFFRDYYSKQDSLESAFTAGLSAQDNNTGPAIEHFHDVFFGLQDVPQRTIKHVATPRRKSACKRINMFLRWMVRSDKAGVDFGIWKKIRPRQLICPLDTHVHWVATGLGLLKRNQADWQAASELTAALRDFDPADPVKYDYALFGLGVEERY